MFNVSYFNEYLVYVKGHAHCSPVSASCVDTGPEEHF